LSLRRKIRWSALSLIALPTLFLLVKFSALLAATPLPGARLLFDGTVPNIHLAIAPTELEQLEKTNRTYVRATITVGNTVWTNVGVRLKGHGSFLPLHEKPSLTVKFNAFVPRQSLDGLTKIMLNNASQDSSLLSEYIAAGMFLEAGVPAARVTHARVHLNARDLGFYVVAESMNKVFLEHHFKNANGNLYDVNAQDIDGRLAQSNGQPGDRSDLAALLNAARLPPGERAQELPRVLDIDRFLSFLAVTMVAAHHDSYPLNRNNYRLYREPASGRFVMMPHGIDGSFARRGLSLELPPKFILTKAIVETPAFLRAYEARVGTVFTNVYVLEKLTNRVWEAIRRLQNAAVAEPERAGIALRGDAFVRRVIERHKLVAAHLAGAPIAPVRLGSGASLAITNWSREVSRGTAELEEASIEGRQALLIHTGPGDNQASWRHRTFLVPGTYRFHAEVRYLEDDSAPPGTSGTPGAPASTGMPRGIALRISGRTIPVQVPPLTTWSPLDFTFIIRPGSEDVELVCEARGGNTRAYFDLHTLRISRE
jgi:hypothetical protein